MRTRAILSTIIHKYRNGDEVTINGKAATVRAITFTGDPGFGPTAHYIVEIEGKLQPEPVDEYQIQCEHVQLEDKPALSYTDDILRRMTDPEECEYDHNGNCQTHYLHEAPCPHAQAKTALQALGAYP